MASKAPASSAPRSGCTSCSCGCGCGCFLFLLPFLVLAGIIVWYVGPAWADLRAKPSIPETIPVTREDRDRLDDKLRAWTIASASEAASLELTLPEANALLSRFHPPPFSGLVIDKVQLISGAPKPKLLVTGSGFWFTDLVIQLQVNPHQVSLDPVSIQINRHTLLETAMFAAAKRLVEQYWDSVPVSRERPLRSFLTDIQVTESALKLSGRSPLGIVEKEE